MKLLVFKNNQLGDNVVFFPVFEQLAKSFEGAEITLVTSPVASPLYKTARFPGVDVIEVAKSEFDRSVRNPVSASKWVAKFRALRPEGCLLSEDQGSAAALLAWGSGAPVIVGADMPYLKLRRLVRYRVPAANDDRAPSFNWRIGRRFAHELGREWPPGEDVPPPDFSCFLDEIGRDEKRVVIQPGASRRYKKWPVDRYVSLAERLADTFEIVWVVGPGEVLPDGGLPGGVEAVSPKNVVELVRLLGAAGGFVGNNSAGMNVAAGLGLKSVILNGPSNAFWDPIWYPERTLLMKDNNLPCQPCDSMNGPSDRCRRKSSEDRVCLTGLSVERVELLCRLKFSESSTASFC